MHFATHNTWRSRLEIVRPAGGAKFIAYQRLEEVEGASVEERRDLLACSAK